VFAFVITASLVAIAWARLAVRSVRLAKASPRLGKTDLYTGTEFPSVVAIIPAHNEAAGIEAVVTAVLGQNWPAQRLRLIVVNDQSTDQTGPILEQLTHKPEWAGRLEVITGAERPPGWAGKTWAVHQATSLADQTEPWLWMVDSDMALHADILRVAYAEALRTGADLVSLTAGVNATTLPQRTTALAMIHLLWQIYPLPHVNRADRPEALAHGAFLLIKRAMYDQIGGMEALRHEIIEDIRLAQRVKAAGGTLAVRAAPRLTRTAFYGNLGDIFNGLRKNAYAGMDYMPHKFWTGLFFGILFTWLPLIAFLTGFLMNLINGPAWSGVALCLIGLTGWIFQAQSLGPIVVYLDLPWYYAFSLPLGGSLYIWACCLSYLDFVRGRVVWRGRNFHVDQLHFRNSADSES